MECESALHLGLCQLLYSILSVPMHLLYDPHCPSSLQQASCEQLSAAIVLTLPYRVFTVLIPVPPGFPGFLLMLSMIVSIINLMGLRITSFQGPPCLFWQDCPFLWCNKQYLPAIKILPKPASFNGSFKIIVN